MAPKVSALIQEKIMLLLSTNLAQARVIPVPAASTEGAELSTAAIPPVKVIGRRDIKASRIARRCISFPSLLARGITYFSIETLILCIFI